MTSYDPTNGKPGSGIAAAPAERKSIVRKRADLQTERQGGQDQTWWVVKDPLTLRYFQLSEEEYTVLEMLNQSVSLAEIKARLEARFPPRVVSYEQLQALLHRFHERGLVYVDAIGQGAQLLQRHQRQSRWRRRARWMNPLFIQLPLVDPESLLGWLYPKVRWLFQPASAAAACLLVFSALVLVTLKIEHVAEKLPTLQQFFGAGNLIWLMVALALAKGLHELAHGLTCRHYGGECHEMGVVLLVLTPCLYCETSDNWMLPNKWQRAMVGAAGMLWELALASVCTWIWWFTQPGLLHYLCLNIMFISSVSTLLFNCNPLLRFDGYYILSDVLEFPNLSTRARAALAGMLKQWFLAMPWTGEASMSRPKRIALTCYAVVAACYRTVILLLILWFLSQVFAPYGLQIVGHALIGLTCGGIVLMPAAGLVKTLRVPGNIGRFRFRRLAFSGGLLVALLLLILFFPLQSYVRSPVIIEPQDADRIYVIVPGVLDEVLVHPGDRVTQGQRLARLTDLEVALEVARLRGQRDRWELHLRNLRRQQGRDTEAAGQIPVAESALADVAQRLDERMEDQRRLDLLATTDGVVLAPPHAAAEKRQEAGLATWSGTPLDEKNLGSTLESGTLFCLIGETDQMEAMLVIDQGDVEFVHTGQQVEVKLDEYPSETLRGQVGQVAQADMRQVPEQLSHKTGGQLTTVTGEQGGEWALNTVYRARVELPATEIQLLTGFRGSARIDAGRRCLAQQLWREIQQLFHFH